MEGINDDCACRLLRASEPSVFDFYDLRTKCLIDIYWHSAVDDLDHILPRCFPFFKVSFISRHCFLVFFDRLVPQHAFMFSFRFHYKTVFETNRQATDRV